MHAAARLSQDHRSARDLGDAARQCAKLKHWRFADDLKALWAHKVDYLDWINLNRENLDTIGLLESEWNDFDRLTPNEAGP